MIEHTFLPETTFDRCTRIFHHFGHRFGQFALIVFAFDAGHNQKQQGPTFGPFNIIEVIHDL